MNLGGGEHDEAGLNCGPEGKEVSQGFRRKPVVSVIVPAYNKPEYLPECLRSIQAQTFADWECIVVDDCSPRGDEIRAAVEAMNDVRFRLVRHEVNRGPAAARNTGVRLTEAEWVILVDEDDMLARECLEVLLSTGLKKDADIVHPQVKCADGTLRKRLYGFTSREDSLHSQPMLGVGFLVRRGALAEIGPFDEAPEVNGREDTEWWIRAIHSGCGILTLPERLYIVRPPQETGGSRSHNLRSMQYERKIRQYIVSKHEDLYRGKQWARRRMIAKGYWWEGYWNAENGDPAKGACLMLASLFIAPSAHGLRNFLGYWWNKSGLWRVLRRNARP